MRSEDVARRRRAVLILGKYRARPAVEAVVACLRDPDAEVRRSAAVALGEWEVLPPAAQPEVLRLLGDDSVQVRRVASSMLPDVLGGRVGLGDGIILIGREPLVSGPLPPASKEFAETLNQALQDEDMTVRRNVLTAARFLPGALRRESLEPCLLDADREIRVLAVQAFAQLRGDEAARVEALAKLAGDADNVVRRELARALARLGAAGFAGLERLAEDADPAVRSRAVQELVQLQHPRGLELLERTVLDERIAADERRSLLLYAGFYGESVRPLLTRLAGERSAGLRAEAVRGLSRLSAGTGEGPDFLVSCLADESIEVRRTAAQGLTRWVTLNQQSEPARPWPTAEETQRWLTSPYSDVRLLAIRLSLRLASAVRLEVLTDALLDDDTAVRCEGIQHLAMLGTAEAISLLARSLDDPDGEVALAAVRAMAARPSAQSRELLEAFHGRCQDATVKAAVAAVLAETAAGRPVRLRPTRWPNPPPFPGESLPTPRRPLPLPRAPRQPEPPTAPP